MSRAAAMKRLNALDKQGWRKLAAAALKKARNPNKYKVEGKGYRTRYFKKLASASAHYAKLKRNNARPRITSLYWAKGASVWTSLQRLDLRAKKFNAPVPRMPKGPASDLRHRVPTSLIKEKVREPLYTPEQWNTTLVGVRVG